MFVCVRWAPKIRRLRWEWDGMLCRANGTLARKRAFFFREDLAYDSGAALEGSPAGVGG